MTFSLHRVLNRILCINYITLAIDPFVGLMANVWTTWPITRALAMAAITRRRTQIRSYGSLPIGPRMPVVSCLSIWIVVCSPDAAPHKRRGVAPFSGGLKGSQGRYAYFVSGVYSKTALNAKLGKHLLSFKHTSLKLKGWFVNKANSIYKYVNSC